MLTNYLIEPGRIELRDVARPHPERGEVLLRVRAALTCGTDLKAFLRGHPKWPMPTPFGHEFAGTAVEVGEGVAPTFDVGDDLMCVPSAPCNDCIYCRKGVHNLCALAMHRFVLGAYSEYLIIPAHIVAQNCFKKPAHLPFAQAALLEPLACVVYSLSQLPVGRGDHVVVIGVGPIGLLHVMLAKRAGATVTAIGLRPYRLAKAQAVGADHTLRADTEDCVQGVRALTGDVGADKVFECTGQPTVWESTVDYLRLGGEVMLYGGCAPGTKVTFDTKRLHYGQVTLKSVFHYTPSAVAAACDILAQGTLPFAELVTGDFGIDQLAEALRRFHQEDNLKLVMRETTA